MKATIRASLFAAALCATAYAHQSPADCTGNGVNLNMVRMPATILNGGIVTYMFSASNLNNPAIGLLTCDAEDIDVVFYCPGADGNPDYSSPIVLTTNLNLPAGTPSMAIGGMQVCMINVNPGVTDARAQVVAGSNTNGAFVSMQ